MGSTSNTLMVVCVVGVLVLLMGADAAPRASPVRTHKKPVTDPAGADMETVPLLLDANQTSPSHASMSPIWNHSISPWTYKTEIDDTLFPRVISEAKCSLKGCLNRHGVEDMNLESKPIRQQILVLRRVEKRGPGSEKSYHYKLESKVISVGCTCIMPSVKHQQ